MDNLWLFETDTLRLMRLDAEDVVKTATYESTREIASALIQAIYTELLERGLVA